MIEVAGGEHPVRQNVVVLGEPLDLVADEVHVGLQRAGGVEERAGLRVEVEDDVVAGEPGRPLIENDVPLGDDVFRLQVGGHLVRKDLDVLVFEDDVSFEDGVLAADNLLPGRRLELHVSALLLDAGRDAELGLRLVVVLPGRAHVLYLREEERRSGGEDERGGGDDERRQWWRCSA